jgi:hypothetical protein
MRRKGRCSITCQVRTERKGRPPVKERESWRRVRVARWVRGWSDLVLVLACFDEGGDLGLEVLNLLSLSLPSSKR